jgi:hypothetical protein
MGIAWVYREWLPKFPEGRVEGGGLRVEGRMDQTAGFRRSFDLLKHLIGTEVEGW